MILNNSDDDNDDRNSTQDNNRTMTTITRMMTTTPHSLGGEGRRVGGLPAPSLEVHTNDIPTSSRRVVRVIREGLWQQRVKRGSRHHHHHHRCRHHRDRDQCRGHASYYCEVGRRRRHITTTRLATSITSTEESYTQHDNAIYSTRTRANGEGDY